MSVDRLKLAAYILSAVCLGACSGQKTLSPEDVKIQVGNVRSFAAGAQLLCESLSKGETTETFFRTQASLLADKADTAASDLDANGGNTEDARRRGQMLAIELRSLLQTLENDPNAAAKSLGQTSSLTKNASRVEDALRSSE